MSQPLILFEHNSVRYTEESVSAALRACGAKRGDTLFVHSELSFLGKVSPELGRGAFLGGFVRALEAVVGLEGTIVMPTFSYSYCKGEVYDPLQTPSTVGVLTEYFRTLPDTLRSSDAIFSVAARGKDAAYFTDVGENCFGTDSIFAKLYARNALLVFIGTRFDITYIHFVEQQFSVPYRYMKYFKGRTKRGGSFEEHTFAYNVRPLDQDIEYNLEGIARFLERKRVLFTAPLGYARIRAVRAAAASVALRAGLAEDPYFLLIQKPTRPISPEI